VAAVATSLHEPKERGAARLLGPAVLVLVASLHAALLLVASHWQTRIDVRTEESLVFLPFPAHMQSPEEPSAPPSSPRKKPAPTHDTQLVVVPAPAEPPPAEQKPAIVDWNAEAALTVKQRAEAAAAPQPRALDQRSGGMYVDGGLPPDQGAPEFGWDHARTHRVEPMEGGGAILWLNDRCFLVLYGVIPLPMCGIGKIPVRGDLFDHMRDPKTQEPNAINTAP
jgi:hypothetical protein